MYIQFPQILFQAPKKKKETLNPVPRPFLPVPECITLAVAVCTLCAIFDLRNEIYSQDLAGTHMMSTIRYQQDEVNRLHKKYNKLRLALKTA